MTKTPSVIIAEAAASVMSDHIQNLQNQIAGDQRALDYTSAVGFSEEDTPESILISERAMKAYLISRLEFNKSEQSKLQEAYTNIKKFVW